MNKFSLMASVVFLSLACKAQVVEIPDNDFRSLLLASESVNGIPYTKGIYDINDSPILVDSNYDNILQQSEIDLIGYINFEIFEFESGPYYAIYSLAGINSFTNLRSIYYGEALEYCHELHISGLAFLISVEMENINSLTLDNTPNLKNLTTSGTITNFDFSGLSNLETLDFRHNLSSVDLTALTNIKTLKFEDNNLSDLNLTGLVNLEELDVQFNQLTTLDLSSNVNLITLNALHNHLSSVNINGLHNIQTIYCQINNLTQLDLTGLANLQRIDVHDNDITELDFSNCVNLSTFFVGMTNVSENQLTTLNIKNGRDDEGGFYFAGNPLQYVCCDESEIDDVTFYVNQYNLPQCAVNTYCSFVPGGDFYTLKGNVKFDIDANGCSASDIAVGNIKVIVSGTAETTVISDGSGIFSIPLQQETYTVTPVPEHPEYFNISPANMLINLTADTDPVATGFCIAPTAQASDMEISLIPVSNARPGFNAVYKLIYKNNGNHAQSGIVNLSFDGSVLDYITANPVPASQTESIISWNFDELNPLESGSVSITMNVNSPFDTPSVNNGDILHFTATISSSQTDETPLDNTFTLNQTVVNSFDPNDKTCLEGNTITPEMVGKYIHYMIRFENTGTANAENIVVKDMIDTSKFDIASLIPLDGSHPFTTRITDTNKVEFIFENIQLPFDDANNDGYVAFKIKTKPTLVVGNTFSNTANIYFDYNAPIVTNTATTAIQVLGTDDFDFNDHFLLFPNPVNGVLNIKSKDNSTIHLLSVYNVLGQVIMTITNPVDSIDASQLASGNYFIKIISDAGTASAKFIKK